MIITLSRWQHATWRWLLACLGPDIAKDRDERNYRFLEEVLELVQACGATKEDAIKLVDYVFDRPVGEKANEVGGVMTTLAVLCTAHGISLENSSLTEHQRCWTIMDEIRAKQASKPIRSPLPGKVQE